MRFAINILSTAAFVLLATFAHANTVPVSWEPVQGVDSYRVTVFTNAGSVVSDTYTTNSCKNLQGLQSGEVYRCIITPIANGNQATDFLILDDIMP